MKGTTHNFRQEKMIVVPGFFGSAGKKKFFFFIHDTTGMIWNFMVMRKNALPNNPLNFQSEINPSSNPPPSTPNIPKPNRKKF